MFQRHLRPKFGARSGCTVRHVRGDEQIDAHRNWPFYAGRGRGGRGFESRRVVAAFDRPCRGTSTPPRAAITGEDVQKLAHGLSLSANLPADTEVAAAVDDAGNLCAILRPRDGLWHP